MPVDDDVAPREGGRQPLGATERGPGHVNHPDPSPRDLDDSPLGERGEELRVVHVPRNGRHRSQPPQIVQHGRRDHVAGVEDQLCALESPQALVRQPSRASRQMRVRDDGDERQEPFRNAPSR